MAQTQTLKIYLKDWRKSRGMGQKALAAAAGLSVQHVSNIETGRSQVSSASLARMAAALHCDAADLLAPPPKRRARPPRAAGFAERVAPDLDRVGGLFIALADLERRYPERVPAASAVAWRLVDRRRNPHRRGI
jgi:transcriptional regulator with XRE-family HTH domain